MIYSLDYICKIVKKDRFFGCLYMEENGVNYIEIYLYMENNYCIPYI